jgi:outer membrane protein assembly factor BamA
MTGDLQLPQWDAPTGSSSRGMMYAMRPFSTVSSGTGFGVSPASGGASRLLATTSSRVRRGTSRTRLVMQILDAVLALTVAATVGATCSPLTAQTPTQPTLPEIERVEFRGVRSLPVREAQAVVSTVASSVIRKRHLEPGQLERDVASLHDFYWRHGYREVAIDTTVRPSGRGVAVTFDVSEGPLTVVDSVDIQQTTPALDTATVHRALRLHPGAPLDLAALDSTLAALRNALWDDGYADAALTPNVIADARTHRASVRIDVNPRWRTRVASLEIEGNRLMSRDAIRSALTLRPGGLYRRQDVAASLRHLYESRVVASAFIAVPPNASDSLTPVVVRVQERNPLQFGMDAAFSTSEFLQVAGRVGLFSIDGGLWQLVVRGATGNLLASGLEGVGPFTEVAPDDSIDKAFLRPTWNAQVEATRLWAGSPRNRLTLAAFGQRLSEPNAFIDRALGLSTLFTREVTEHAGVLIGYRLERAAVEAGDVYFCESFGLCDASALSVFRDFRRLSSVSLGGSLNGTNNLVAPSRGQSIRIDMEYASPATGSEYDFFHVDGEGAAYRPMGSWVLATHVHAGWAHTAAGDVLHPRLLFYAGGSQSVRGYRENQLGPRVLRVRAADLVANGCTDASIADGSCDPNAVPRSVFSPQPVGATALLESSVELRKRFVWGLGGVLFVDGAVVGPGAGTLSGERVSAVTPGVGLRYATPFGELRLDAGWQPDKSERLPVLVETTAADGSSQLVRLTTDRQWTSMDDANGKHGLRRVTLHFALGHAF